MIEKVLSVTTSPPVITYLKHAHLLEILMNYEEFIPEFYMRYIQLNFLRNKFAREDVHYLEFLRYEFSEHPWLIEKNITYNELIEQGINIVNHIVEAINQEYYVRVNVDEYYIPDKSAYNKTHFDHPLQIFGYNLDKKYFHISGFNNKGMYINHTVEFNDLLKAIESNSSDVKFVLRKKGEDAHCEFDVNIIKHLLYQYLNSENSNLAYPSNNHRMKEELYWGIDIYKGLKTYINLFLEDKVLYDIRPWHLLWEHKKNMLLRIRYMQGRGYLPEQSSIYNDYEVIEQNALSMRNVMMKYTLTNDKKLLKRLINSIDVIVIREQETLSRFLHEL